MITVAARSKPVSCVEALRSHAGHGLRHELSSNAGIVGSNPTRGMAVFVCVYSMFVLGSGLATGLSPMQGVLADCLSIKKLKSNKAFRGCDVLQVGATGNRERCSYSYH
jgi:hypothetical protein